MFRKPLCYLLCALLAFPTSASSQAVISPPPRVAAPMAAVAEAGDKDTGGSAIDTFLPDLFLGSPRAEIPLTLPLLRNTLRLSLNPQFIAGQRGVMGQGWDLPIPRISRLKRLGINYSDRNFTLSSAEGSGELVEVSPGQFQLLSDDKLVKVHERDGHFSLINRDGTRTTFGTTRVSRMDDATGGRIFSWLIDRSEDRNGNYVVFEYEKESNTPYLKAMRYGANSMAGGEPPFEVLFTYVPDTLSPEMFDLDYSVQNKRILATIDVRNGGRLIHSYYLDYLTDANAGTRFLRSVEQRGVGGVEKRSFIFEQHPTTTLATTPYWGAGPAPGSLSNQCLVGDFDGNGKADIACYTGGGGNWHVALSSGANWNSPYWGSGPAPGLPLSNQCFAADLNGDGKTDVACYTGGAGNWHVAISNGSGWNAAYWSGGPAPGSPLGQQCIPGDFNGDGKADLACYTGTGGNWHLALSSGSGWISPYWGSGPAPAIPLANQCTAGDFNNDGKTDIACYTGGGGRWHVAMATGTGWLSQFWDSGPSPGAVANQCFAGDFNGDGKSDIACYTGGAGNWHLALSTGSSWKSPYWGGGPAPALPLGNQCLTGDFNGDGKTDIACYTGGGGQWHIAVSSGGGWHSPYWTGPAPGSPVSSQCLTGNFNGDGATDIACYTGGGGNYHMWLSKPLASLALASTQFPTGLRISYDYEWVDTTKQRYLPASIPVLKALNLDPGGGSTAQLMFEFKEGYFHSSAREFRGFGKALVNFPKADDGTRRVLEMHFHQGATPLPNNSDFNAPKALMKGKLFYSETRNDAGKVNARATTTYYQRPALSTFIGVESALFEACDGTPCHSSVRRTFKYDSFGNSINEQTEQSYPGGARTLEMRRTFLTDLARGVIGVAQSEELVDGRTSRRLAFTTFAYDENVNCGGDIVTHGPGRFVLTSTRVSAGNKDLTTWLAYDAHGNVVCRRLPSGAMYRMTYDKSGNFLRKIINPLGFENSFEYYGIDGNSVEGGPPGFMQLATDANGSALRSEYDSLGRKAREDLPGGAGWTSWRYFKNGVSDVIHTTEATGEESFEARDGLNRLMHLSSRTAEGRWLDLDRVYSPNGHLSTTRGPALRGSSVASASTKHDSFGRVIETVDPNGSPTRLCHNQNRTVAISPSGEAHGKDTDGNGRVLRVYSLAIPIGSDCATAVSAPPGLMSSFNYDAMGRVEGISRAGRTTTAIRYNLLGQKVKVQDANNGTTEYKYDGDGRVVEIATAGGVTQFFQYDASGRVLQRDFERAKNLGAGDIRFEYDKNVANGRGRLAKTITKHSTKVFQYDAVGNVVTENVEVVGEAAKVTREFDMKRRPLKVASGAHSIGYEYDSGRLSKIHDGRGVLVAAEGFNIAGASTKYSVRDLGTLETDYFAPTGAECTGSIARICKISARNANGNLMFVEGYEYDKEGRIAKITGEQQITNVSRDSLGRVIRVENTALALTSSSSNLAPKRPDERFEYDDSGRIKWSSKVGHYTYRTDGGAPLDGPLTIGGKKVSYRKDGKISRIGSHEFVYNSRGLLQKYHHGRHWVHYAYGASTELARVTSPQSDVRLLSDTLICKGAKCDFQLPGIGPLTLRKVRGGKELFVSDATLAPRLRVVGIESEKIFEKESYSAFGSPVSGSGVALASRKGIGAQAFSAEGSLYLLGERAFHPSTGLFLAPDPVQAFEPRSALSAPYTYGNGDPLTFRDPEGELAWFVPIIVGAIIGATVAAVRGDDILRGAAMGAIGGAFYWAGVWLGGGAIGFAVAGAGSGATNAALFGGNVEQAALQGAMMGAVSGFLMSGDVSVFGSANPWSGTADYLINSTLRGAAAGGAYAAFTGNDIGDGIQRGAATGAIGGAINMAAGHLWGLAATRQAPQWKNGAWFYEDDKTWPISIGNVISGDRKWLDSNAGIRTPNATVRDHELGHITQSATLGVAYGPAVLLSYAVGGAWGATFGTGGFQEGTHKYSFFENDAGYNAVPAY